MIAEGAADPQRVLDTVFGRVDRVVVGDGARDDAAFAVTLAYLTEVGPAWLMRTADATRLDVLTCLEVLRHRRTPTAPDETDPLAALGT